MRPALVIISDVVPTHSSEPGSPRLYSLSREWSERFQLVLLIRSEKNDSSDIKIHPEVRKLFKDIVPLPSPSKPAFLGKLSHRLHNAPFFLFEYKDRPYVQMIRNRVSEVLSNYTGCFLHVNYLSNVQFVPLDRLHDQVTVDVRDDPTLLYEREVKLESRFFRRMALINEARAHGRYLKKIARFGLKIIMVGRDDQNHLKSKLGIQTLLAPNGIDSNYFCSALPRDRVADRAVFTGVMDYKPNMEAVVYFANKVFPIIRNDKPSAEFMIVGTSPPAEVISLASRPGITVTGYVPDVRPFLEEATVFVCPMLSGAGIKNKILAAMAVGIPIVSTELGVSGIVVEEGIHFLLANDVITFSKHILSVFNEPGKYQGMVVEAQNFVIQHHSWKVAADKIASCFKSGSL